MKAGHDSTEPTVGGWGGLWRFASTVYQAAMTTAESLGIREERPVQHQSHQQVSESRVQPDTAPTDAPSTEGSAVKIDPVVEKVVNEVVEAAIKDANKVKTSVSLPSVLAAKREKAVDIKLSGHYVFDETATALYFKFTHINGKAISTNEELLNELKPHIPNMTASRDGQDVSIMEFLSAVESPFGSLKHTPRVTVLHPYQFQRVTNAAKMTKKQQTALREATVDGNTKKLSRAERLERRNRIKAAKAEAVALKEKASDKRVEDRATRVEQIQRARQIADASVTLYEQGQVESLTLRLKPTDFHLVTRAGALTDPKVSFHSLAKFKEVPRMSGRDTQLTVNLPLLFHRHLVDIAKAVLGNMNFFGFRGKPVKSTMAYNDLTHYGPLVPYHLTVADGSVHESISKAFSAEETVEEEAAVALFTQ